jgi:hypothetical protein
MSSPDQLPRITLRPEELAAIRASGLGGVGTVRLVVADEDWIPFLRDAYEGMEIPVRLEGESGYCETAVLLRADHISRSILVVI